MADEKDIIVLDDDDEEEGGLSPSSKAKTSPPKPLPPETKSHAKVANANSPNQGTQSAENQRLFQEFVDYCSKLTSEHPDVIPFLQGRYSKASPTYLASVEFRNTLGNCFTRLKSKHSKVFVYINDLITALKAHTTKKRVSTLPQAASAAAAKGLVAENADEKEEAQEEVQEKQGGSKRQIRYLENLLRLYSQEIRKLTERELSLDDMEDEDSTYIQECRLKRKLLRIFEKLCDLKDCNSSTGRVIEQRIIYQGTRYPEINRRLEKFINKTRDDFPDYGDVFKVVERTNEKHDLGLTRKQLQSIAQDSFRDLGNKLQQRRRLDMAYNFGCHLTDTYKKGYDPAEQDSALARRLRENRNLAENRLEDVIKKYADMQDDGEQEEWKRRDSEKPSTSRDLRSSPRSRPTTSQPSSESEEEDDESEESEVDIEDELLKSKEAEDNEEEVSEDNPAEEENEADQKMEETSETSDPQNLSPSSGAGGNGEAADADGDRDVIEDDREDEEQDSTSASTSLSPEQDVLNTSIQSKEDLASCASPGRECDTPPDVKLEEELDKLEERSTPVEVISDGVESGNQTKEQLEDSDLEEDVAESKVPDVETADVPYAEVNTATGEDQDAAKCPDTPSKSSYIACVLKKTKEDLMKEKDTPPAKPKEEKINRLDKYISKIADQRAYKGSSERKGLTQRETPPSSDSDGGCSATVNKSTSDGTLRLYSVNQSSNGRLDCVDTPTNSLNSVRKIAFRRKPPLEKRRDVLRLDSCRASTPSDTSNGVHRATIRPAATPINRLKLIKKDAPKDSCISLKIEGVKTSSSKRKSLAQRWTENGVANCNGRENGEDEIRQESKRAKFDCPDTPLSNTSEPSSDNEHDITLDLVVTCSPPETPTKPRILHSKKLDVSTQCDPDEVIVLSD